MKKTSYLKKMSLAVVAMSLGMGTSAQSIASFSFYAGQDETKLGFIPGTHRSRPAVGDFNNDGYIDLYYGGQDPGASTGWDCLSNLVRNNGDGTFTPIGADDSGISINSKSNFLFWDYNNDGNLDLLFTGDSEYGLPVPRYTCLFKNLGEAEGYKFEQQFETGLRTDGTPTEDYGKAFATGDYDKDGFIDLLITGERLMVDGDSYNDTRYAELYRNNGDGTFTKQEGIANHSSGAVAFGDLDNDGWLDIIITGYPGDNEAEARNQFLRIYKNEGDGTFTEKTNVLTWSHGNFDSETIVADMNGDGLLDIVAIGYSTGYNRITSLLTNNGDFDFSVETLEIDQAGRTTVLAVDLNHDGLMDLIYAGKDHNDGDKDKNWIYYQTTSGHFTLEPSTSIEYTEASSTGIALGDFNGDNAMDIVITGYNAGVRNIGCIAEIYVNDLGEGISANEAPSAPGNVQAVITDGQLNIVWDAATDDHTATDALRYNIYVEGENGIFMLVPAHTETGQLKVVSDLSVTTARTDYSMALPEGKYTIGVQAIDQSHVAGPFATTTVGDEETNIGNTSKDNSCLVKVIEDGFLVETPIDADVIVRDLSGRTVSTGKTNTVLPVVSKGVYLISVSDKTFKVVK